MLTILKMARKPVKVQKESTAGCAGEDKQSKGNEEKRKGRFKDESTTAFCEEERVTSRKCEVKGRVCEICLGRSSYGEGGRGMRSCYPTIS